MEGSPVKALPAPKRTPLKAVSEHVRNRAIPAPRGMPLQARETWPGLLSAPPPEAERGMELWNKNSTRNRKQAWRQRPSSRCPRERQLRRCLGDSGTEHHHRQKERHYNNERRGLACRRVRHLNRQKRNPSAGKLLSMSSVPVECAGTCSHQD